MKMYDVASVVLFVDRLERFREICAGLETKETFVASEKNHSPLQSE
jgi:hypothetical protein